jgi:hypothetical protein
VESEEKNGEAPIYALQSCGTRVGDDLLPKFRRKVYMNLRDKEERDVEGET